MIKDNKLARILNFIDNFFKLAGAEDSQIAKDFKSILSLVDKFEDSFAEDTYKKDYRKSVYANIQYLISLTIIFMKSGVGLDLLKKALDSCDTIVNVAFGSTKGHESVNSLNYAEEIIAECTKISSSNIYLKFNKNNQKIEDSVLDSLNKLTKSSNNLQDGVKLLDSDEIKSILNLSSDQISTLMNFVQDDEERPNELKEMFDEFQVLKPEIDVKDEGGQSQFEQREHDDKMSSFLETGFREVVQSNEGENSGVKTIDGGLYDAGVQRLESNIANFKSKKDSWQERKRELDKNIQIQQNIKKTRKLDERFEQGIQALIGQSQKISEIVKNYENWLSIAEIEKNNRIVLSSEEREFYSELDTVLSSSTKDKLSEDVKSYQDSKNKLSELTKKLRRGVISKDTFKEERKRLQYLIETTKESKESYLKLKRQRGTYIAQTVVDKKNEIEKTYESDPTNPRKEEELRGLEEARIFLENKIKKITEIRNVIYQYSSQKENINRSKIKITESDYWLASDGERVKIDQESLDKGGFNKQKYMNALKKIRHICSKESSTMKTLGLVGTLDVFLAKQEDPSTATNSEAEIKAFYKKIMDTFQKRTPNQYYNPTPKTTIYTQLDNSQKDFTTIITNEFAHLTPIADEAFINFLEDPATEIDIINDQFIETIKEMAESTKMLGIEKGTYSDEYQSAVNDVNNFYIDSQKLVKKVHEISSNKENMTLIKNKLKVAKTLKALYDAGTTLNSKKNEVISSLSMLGTKEKKIFLPQKVKSLKEAVANVYNIYKQYVLEIERDPELKEVAAELKQAALEMGYIEKIELLMSQDWSLSDLQRFTASKGTDKRPYEKKLAQLMGVVKEKILNHIVAYKASSKISKTTEIYYTLKKINDDIVTIKSLLNSVQKKQQEIEKDSKIVNKKDELLKSKIQSASQNVKGALGNLENKTVHLNVSEAVETMINLSSNILGDMEWQSLLIHGIPSESTSRAINNVISALTNVMDEMSNFLVTDEDQQQYQSEDISEVI